jgi:hypothetical protein
MLLLLPFAVVATARLSAQDAPTVQEPDYANSFFYLDTAGNMQPLEREPVGVGSKVHALGFGGADASYQVKNPRSTVRFAAGAPIAIVVKLEDAKADPANVVVLYPLQVNKDHRQLMITKVGFMGMHSKSDVQDKQMQMNFAKYGQESTKVTMAAPLAPGEYAIGVQAVPGQQITAFCFGIDPAS